MSQKLKAYGSSFLIHLVFLLIFALFSNMSLQPLKKPIEVDLNLMEFEAPKPTSSEKIHREEKTISKPSEKPQISSPQVFHKTNPKEESKPLQENVENTQSQSVSTVSKEENRSENSNLLQATYSQGSQANTLESKTTSEKIEENKKPVIAPAQQQKDQYLKEKLSVISQIVQKNISYPLIARRMGWEGRVVLSIRICEDGSVSEIKVLESSGYEVLDKNAVETVKKVAHLFPRPPTDVIVRLPVSYRLE